MKLMSLSICGIQETTAVMTLVDIQKHHNPNILFLMEAHLDVCPTECLRQILNIDHKEVVRTNGHKGGLLFGKWKLSYL
jgi:hypothetical protein